MGTLGYKYILYGYMEPLGKMPGFRVLRISEPSFRLPMFG